MASVNIDGMKGLRGLRLKSPTPVADKTPDLKSTPVKPPKVAKVPSVKPAPIKAPQLLRVPKTHETKMRPLKPNSTAGERLTIRIGALRVMLHAEIAADDWFAKMSKKEQQAYIKAHPHSKFGTAPVAHVAGVNEATKLANYHQKKYEHHITKQNSLDHHFDDHGLLAYKHDNAAHKHDNASFHFRNAADEYTKGNHVEGDKSMDLGHYYRHGAHEYEKKHPEILPSSPNRKK